jgi:hypothetical protein
VARGFNTTYGTGTNDQVTAISVAESRVRSKAFWIYVTGWNTQTQMQQTNGDRVTSDGGPTLYSQHQQWSGGVASFSCAPPAVNGWHHICVTYDSNSTSNVPVIYVDGVSQTVTTGLAASGTYTAGTGGFVIGNRPTLGRAVLGMMAEVGIWNAILDAGEVKSLAAGAPASLIRPAALQEYLPLVSGLQSRKQGVASTSGTVVQPHPPIWSHNAPDMPPPAPRALMIAAAAGAYAITGAANALRTARQLAATTAAYAYSGTAATLTKAGNKTMPAAAGAYALTGTANVLSRGRTMAAVAGAYVYTGTVAALRGGKAMAAAAGAYAITGTANAFRRTRVMPANAGAYSINGSAAALNRTLKMAASSAAYTISGTIAALRNGRAMAASSAAYTISGTANAFRRTRVMPAVAGAYAITGTAIALTTTAAKTLVANAGAYALSGSANALRVARRFAAVTAAYTITGTANALRRSRPPLVAATGAYVHTGTTAVLRAARRLVAIAGAYLVSGAAAGLAFGQTRFYYLAEIIEEMAASIMAAIGNTDVTIDLGGPGQVMGVRAIRQSRSYDPTVGVRNIESAQTEFLVVKLTQPASLRPGVIIRDETNADQFRVFRLTYTRGGMTTIEVKNV